MNTILGMSKRLLSLNLITPTQFNVIQDPMQYIPGNCAQLLDPAFYNNAIGLTSFDNGLGQAMLIGGGQCSAVLTLVITQIYNTIVTVGQINPFIYDELGIPESLMTALYYEYLTYSDGYALMTTWSWGSLMVGEGQSAGLCISQDNITPGSFVSCWTIQKENGSYKRNKSYLIDPALL